MEIYSNPETIVFTTPLPDITRYLSDKSVAILDLGCGYGRVLKHCFDLGYTNLTGIDASQKLIERAKENCPMGKFINGDITQVVDGLMKFDLILVCGVIEYIIDDNERIKLLLMMKEHLNENGKILLETFIIDETEKIYSLSEKQGFKYGTIKLSTGMILRHSTVNEIDDLFEGASFEKIEGKEENYTTWVGAITPGYTSVWTKRKGDMA